MPAAVSTDWIVLLEMPIGAGAASIPLRVAFQVVVLTPSVGSTLLRFCVRNSTLPSSSTTTSIRSPLPAR